MYMLLLFFQSWYKKSDTDPCIYPVLSSTYQAKAVKKRTQHVRETTSEGNEEDVGETIRRWNGRNPNEQQEHLFEFLSASGGSR